MSVNAHVNKGRGYGAGHLFRGRKLEGIRREMLGLFVLMSALALVPSPGLADDETSEGGEFSVLTGGTFGAISAHPSIGGSAGISLSRYAMTLVEASVIPLGGITLLRTEPAVKVSGSDLFDFNWELQVRIPVKRWEPYAMFGTAILMNSYRSGLVTPLADVIYHGERHSKFALEGGMGFRYYVSEKWGIRAEYRYRSSATNFSQFQTGVFYQVEPITGFRFKRGSGRP